MGAMKGPALRLLHVDSEKKKFTGFVKVPFSVWSKVATFGDLERHLTSATGRRVVYIAYRGLRLRKFRRIASLIPDLQDDIGGGGPCSRFSVHTTSGENIFFVKSLTGKSVMVDLPLATSTVTDLKKEVEALEFIPIEYQRFIYNGQHFADKEPITKSLRDYGVQRDSTVQLLSRLRGGSNSRLGPGGGMLDFADLQNSSALQTLPWSKGAPIWRLVAKGLNLEGKCTNQSCAAVGRRVVCQKGFAVVNLVTDAAYCPVCLRTVQVTTCSFTDCSWMFEGRKAAPNSIHKPKFRPSLISRILTKCFGGSDGEYPAVEKKPTNRDIVSPWFRASDKYEYFNETENIVQWENLLIMAKKTPTVSKNGPSEVIPREGICPICFHEFGDVETHTTTCGHVFHAECVDTWLACSGSGCPICRVELVVEA